jgi:threonylcarbamoyladenosine tRNA methylthiotransferase MtaB
MGLVASSEPGMTRAYIKIQEGCDRFCAYCLIPYARGPVRSRPPEEIVREAVMLLDSGVREIVLTGINTALYGTEAGFEYGLADLLAMLDAIERPQGDDFRIRLSSLEPTVVDKDDVEKIIRFRRLCHHLHLSVQAGSDHILKSMNRHYTRDEYLDIVRAIREYDPLYGITTDIIVGFPGETDEDFADTLDITRRSEFGKVHVFRYSPRKGTVGASLPDAVPGEVKIARSDELEAAASAVARDFMQANTGVLHTILAEEIQDGYMTGYTGNYIKIYIEDSEERLEPGRFYDVRPTELFRDGCKAELV